MARRKPRVLSERKLRWGLNLYPPLFFQGIRVLEIGAGFRSARVRVRRSIANRNLSGTIFGGTIYSAADPIFAVLYWQIFAHRGERLQVWLKAGSADYVRPARSRLLLDFQLADADLAAVEEALERQGKAVRTHRVEARDIDGEICAILETSVYLRRAREDQGDVSGF